MKPEILDLVLRLSNGAILVPLKRAASILGLEPQTLRNQLHLGTCRLEPRRRGRNVFFTAVDLALEIDRDPPQRGRPRKADKLRGRPE